MWKERMEGYSWEDVFKMLEKFVREKMKKDSEYQIALECSITKTQRHENLCVLAISQVYNYAVLP